MSKSMIDLIEEHYVKSRIMLLKILAGRAGTPEGAEDVLHDAYEKALRYKGSYDKDLQTFSAWFNAILNNSLRTYKRNERLLGMSVEYVEGLDDGVSMLDWESDVIKKVKADVEAKEFPQRQILYLYFFKGYLPRDIEKVLDLRGANIRKCVQRFKEQMQEKYLVNCF